MIKKRMLCGLTVSLGLMTSIASAEPLAELKIAPHITPKFTVGDQFIDKVIPQVGECLVLKVVEVTEQGVRGKWMAVTCPSLKRKEMP